MTLKNEVPQIKPYTTKELAMLYAVNRHTFKQWIKPFTEEIGVRIGWYYSPRQVEIIFNRVGLPGSDNGNK